MSTARPTTVATSFTPWYSKIVNFLKHAEVFVSDTFIKLFGADAAHNFAVGAEALLKTDLGKIVTVAVQEAEALATGADKKAAAYSKIMSAVSTQGLNVKTSLVNMLIEVAVGRVNGLFGAPP